MWEGPDVREMFVVREGLTLPPHKVERILNRLSVHEIYVKI